MTIFHNSRQDWPQGLDETVCLLVLGFLALVYPAGVVIAAKRLAPRGSASAGQLAMARASAALLHDPAYVRDHR